MNERFSILLFVLIIVLGLIGGAMIGRIWTPSVVIADTEKSKQSFEYGRLYVYTINIEGKVLCFWTAGSKSFSTGEMKSAVIQPDGVNKLVKDMGINRVFSEEGEKFPYFAQRDTELLLFLFDALGEQGWEFADYRKEKYEPVAIQEYYLFKRRK